MPTDFKGLNNFMRRLEKVKQLETIKDKVSSDVADKGVKLANAAYSNSDVTRAVVTKETSLDGDYAVTAQGEGLSFEEYGTGYYAKGTYKGELPKSGVPITGKWDYWYDSEFKDTIDGKKGWWLGSNFMIGENAGNQMYQTSVDLRKEINETVSKIVKELLE